MLRCLHCQAETRNGLTLCARCQQTLSIALVNTAAYYTDALKIQPGQRVKVRSAYRSTPPPDITVKPDAVSTITDHVDTIITSWVHNLTDDRPSIKPPPPTTAAACGWLEALVPTIATLEWGSECLREIRDCERRLQRLIDRADTGWYAGRCGHELAPERPHDGFTCTCAHHQGAAECDAPCGDEATIPAVTCQRGLYVSPGQNWVRCPECGRTWDAESRRSKMMAEAGDEVAPVRVIARIAVGLTSEVSEERLTRRIEQWVARKQLHDLGVRVLDGRPRRVYRIGDVLRLVTGEVQPRDVEAC